MSIGGAGTGTFSYNGYSLNDGALRVECKQVPLTDDAGRTVVCLETTFTVHTVIQADLATDATLESIRAALTRQGMPLIVINKGFGRDLSINTGGNPKDVRWGPLPKVLEWKPIGDNKAAEIVWQVTTWLPPICSTNGNVTSDGIMAFNYSVDFSINDRGFTTRTITGYVEIAMTRVAGGRDLPSSADNFRNMIRMEAPHDFKREQRYSVSADKRRLDFTLVDKQIESRKAYPAGVIAIRAEHRASWSRGNGQSMMLRNTIRAEIEMAANFPTMQALAIFLNIAFLRIDRQRAAGVGVLIDAFDMEEEIFGLGGSFTISYRTLQSLGDILRAGLWTSLGTNDATWKASVASAFRNRGYAGLGCLPNDDAIVDLCGNAPPYVLGGPVARLPEGFNFPRYQNQKPPQDKSWLQYSMQLEPSRYQPTARQATLQSPDQSSSADNMNADKFQFPASGGTSDIIQVGGRPRYSVVLTGGARRVGYEIPRPALIGLGSQTPVETNCVFNMWSEGDHFGVPVYGAAWAIAYDLPNSPGSVSPKPQLLDGGSGTAAAGRIT